MRNAREQASALLAAARQEADAALAEGQDLSKAMRGIVDTLREAGRKLEADVQQAHRQIAERTSLQSVQARTRVEQPDLDASATAIAAQVVRILSEEAQKE